MEYNESNLKSGQLGSIINNTDDIIPGFDYCMVDDQGNWMPNIRCQIIGIVGYKFEKDENVGYSFTFSQMQQFVDEGRIARCLGN